MELVPARPRLLVHGWVSLSTHAVGFLVALPFAERPLLTLVFFVGFAVVGASLAFAGHRYALKRVSVPLPPGAAIVPARFPSAIDVATAGVTAAIVALSLFGILSAGFLGFGFGSSFAALWAASKIAEFERGGNRQVLRKVGPQVDGDPGLYTTP